MKKSIGILGGMGPLATADLYRKIILLTEASCDSEHIRVYLDGNVTIPNRTAAILEGGEDPLPAMTDSLRKLEACGADCIVMPCNTSHYFLDRLQKETDIPFISILKVTAEACKRVFPGKTAGILATKGALASGLYQKALEEEGLPYLVPGEEDIDALMRVIYDGVKAGAPAETYRADMESVLNNLTCQGADYFILGCTELPPAVQNLGLTVPVIDATEELARAAIRFCGYQEKVCK